MINTTLPLFVYEVVEDLCREAVFANNRRRLWHFMDDFACLVFSILRLTHFAVASFASTGLTDFFL